MKWEWSKDKKVFIVVIIIILFIIITTLFDIKRNIIKEPLVLYDTTYNPVYLDSIIYEINYKDTTIYKINYEYDTKYIEAKNLDDSSAVELFKSLCTDNSLYGGSNASR